MGWAPLNASAATAATDISAVILCGGAGQRMGGADKPLLSWAGRPLIEQILARVRPQVGQVLISANRHHDVYERYAPVLADPPALVRAGPLAGILAGIQACSTSWLLVCAGDAPSLPVDLVARMHAVLHRGDPSLRGVAVTAGTRLEPLPVLLHVTLSDHLVDWLAAGHRSVHGWLATLPLARLDLADIPGAFRNLNTPADFADDRNLPEA